MVKSALESVDEDAWFFTLDIENGLEGPLGRSKIVIIFHFLVKESVHLERFHEFPEFSWASRKQGKFMGPWRERSNRVTFCQPN